MAKNQAEIKFRAETSEFTSGIKDLNNSMNTMNSALRLNATQMKNNGETVDLLKDRQKLLGDELDAASKKSQLAQKNYEKAAEIFGEDSKEAQKYAKELNNAKNQEEKIRAALNETNKKLEEHTDKWKVAQKKTAEASKAMKAAGEKITGVGTAISKASAAVGAVGVAAIKTAADFETSMSQVAATMGMTADDINNGSESYKLLEKAARDCGKATKYSASEAAEALNYMALAGYDAAKAAGTLPTVLNLAAAGNMDLADASDLVTDAMSALGIEADNEGKNVYEFADKLAKASQKSNTSVAQIGEAIKTVGGTARNLSGGLTEASTALGVFADVGIKASEGGTALRNIIIALNPTTDKAVMAFAQLGVNAYDADGSLRPLNETFNDMSIAMDGLSDQEKQDFLTKMFNKTDLAAVNALLDASSKNMDEMKAAMDSAGVSADSFGTTFKNLYLMANDFNDKQEFISFALEGTAMSAEDAEKAYSILTSTVADGSSRFEELAGYIDDSNGAASDMAKTMQNNLNGQITSLQSALSEAGIAAGQVMLPTLKSLTETVQSAVDAFNGLDDGAKRTIVVVGGIVAAAGPLLVILGTVISSIGSIVGGISAAMPVISAIAGGITAFGGAALGAIPAIVSLIVAIGPLAVVIGLAIAAGVAIVKNWDTIKAAAKSLGETVATKFKDLKDGAINKITELKDGAISKFNGMKETVVSAVTGIYNAGKDRFDALKRAIVDPIKSAVDTVKDQVEKIKGFFSGLKISLPKIKLPHFKLTGSFSLTPPSVPKIAVDWYAKGGVLTSPTLFGALGGKLLGGGEAGPEAVAPIDVLQGYVASAVERAFERSFRRDNRPIILQIDGKTIAQTTAAQADRVNGLRQELIKKGVFL